MSDAEKKDLVYLEKDGRRYVKCREVLKYPVSMGRRKSACEARQEARDVPIRSMVRKIDLMHRNIRIPNGVSPEDGS